MTCVQHGVAQWTCGMTLRFFEVFGNNIRLYHWYIDRFYGELFYAKHLDVKIKELLRLKLSTIHGCKFCNQGNMKPALEAGLTKDQIDNLNDYESGPFSMKEKAVLRLADQIALTNTEGFLEKKLYVELKTHFKDGEILELGFIMSILAGIAKFIFVFDLVEKEDNCPFIPKKNENV